MTQEKGTATKLSLNLRKMKFMQRCMSENERQELEESDKIITSEHWELDLPEMLENESRFLHIPSITHFEPCRHGRLSFGGYNKAIEKLMKELEQPKENDDDGHNSDLSISDDEMAERYSSLVGTVGNKFKANSKQSTKKGRKLEPLAEDKEQSLQVKRTKLDKRGFMKPSV
ncbi:unnamed protein product [Clavelina lepadiformis]|uniref:M-phase phosphoprotein 6 n=1 Tax=Clavelina lepadiformis TaxID=159417 RepID=A0ABP0FEF6_CLALP